MTTPQDGTWEENAKFILAEIVSGKESRRILHEKVDKISDELLEVRTMLKYAAIVGGVIGSVAGSVVVGIVERLIK